jgi:hypothetical protein
MNFEQADQYKKKQTYLFDVMKSMEEDAYARHLRICIKEGDHGQCIMEQLDHDLYRLYNKEFSDITGKLIDFFEETNCDQTKIDVMKAAWERLDI